MSSYIIKFNFLILLIKILTSIQIQESQLDEFREKHYKF